MEHLFGFVQVPALVVDQTEVAVLVGHAFQPAELLVDLECLAVQLFGLVQVPAYLVDHTEVAVRSADAFQPAELLVDLQCLAVHLFGLVQVPARLVDQTEVAVIACRLLKAPEPLTDGQHFANRCLRIINLANKVEEVSEFPQPNADMWSEFLRRRITYVFYALLQFGDPEALLVGVKVCGRSEVTCETVCHGCGGLGELGDKLELMAAPGP